MRQVDDSLEALEGFWADFASFLPGIVVILFLRSIEGLLSSNLVSFGVPISELEVPMLLLVFN